jgi:hypothetical protein
MALMALMAHLFPRTPRTGRDRRRPFRDETYGRAGAREGLESAREPLFLATFLSGLRWTKSSEQHE